MIHLRLRTEYSFRRAYGRVDDVLAAITAHSTTAAAITDRGTWGHVAWARGCKKAGVRPILGAEFLVVADATHREKQPSASVAILPRTDAGLQELYRLTTRSNVEGFYYDARIDWGWLAGVSDELVVLLGPGTTLSEVPVGRPHWYLELNPTNAAWNRRVVAARRNAGWPCVVASDNHFPHPQDRAVYEVLAQRSKVRRPTPMHILSEDELRLAVPEVTDDEFDHGLAIAAECARVALPQAENIRIESPQSLRELCLAGAERRRLALVGEYAERLERELAMIAEKRFEDYFFLVGEAVRWAKGEMLVGPARGSAAGSLVCYLLGITDIDPLPHGLLFERFIDETREDLPDVDVDFQDTRRDLVIDHLRALYGEDRVGRIGTVARLKAKSCLADVARELNVPPWEVKAVQGAVIERSTGDARAQFCVRDALDTLAVGRELLAKHPGMRMAEKLEGHAQHTGKHAAGLIVAQGPITNYCSVDREGVAQIDKRDAERLNMLKIDALGLRVLSVLQDALDQIGRTRDWLVDYPLDDHRAFAVLKEGRFGGIFQFEGYALQSLVRQLPIESFEDLAVIGALARPGPLHCGAATSYVHRRTGQEPATYMHPAVAPHTRETQGLVIYQEQVMAIGRDVGGLSWADVSELRKAMSKSLGEEFFNRYWTKFRDGAARLHDMAEGEARGIWEQMCTFGSWAFNKSHSVAYGLIAYWCCVLKAHWPLEFTAACLRHAKDEHQSVQLLRELRRGGHEFTPVDPGRSGLTWSVVDGRLLGGLTSVRGMGPSKAEAVLKCRAAGLPLPRGLSRLLADPSTPYDDIFEGQRRFGNLYAHPEWYGVLSGRIHTIRDIGVEPGEYVVIAKIAERNLRDMNEYGNLQKRGGRRVEVNPLFLNLVLEDDTDACIARVERGAYAEWGKPLTDYARPGEWFLWKGRVRPGGFRLLYLQRWRCLERDNVTLYDGALEPTRSAGEEGEG